VSKDLTLYTDFRGGECSGCGPGLRHRLRLQLDTHMLEEYAASIFRIRAKTRNIVSEHMVTQP
jgi:hypothetical protein